MTTIILSDHVVTPLDHIGAGRIPTLDLTSDLRLVGETRRTAGEGQQAARTMLRLAGIRTVGRPEARQPGALRGPSTQGRSKITGRGLDANRGSYASPPESKTAERDGQ
ncbi:MAG: hypothetical protein JWM31_747 [Solirubrobacterales bacterium]|nr:hypothetical protein [Solirubrobacterales bacterium]